MKRLQKAFPKFVKVESIGKSYDGRDIMLVTINNPATGPASSKAAMYIEANVHGNEIQGGEICLYTDLVPDGELRPARRRHPARQRARLLHHPDDQSRRPAVLHRRARRQRPSGHVPGRRRQRWPVRRGPARGPQRQRRHRADPQVRPRRGQLPASAGRIRGPGAGRPSARPATTSCSARRASTTTATAGSTRTRPGGYDGNRNYPSDWQPNYIQSGAMDYPDPAPRGPGRVVDFLYAHPNIAGVQSYHNNGGMILRGPGAEAVGEYPMTDVRALRRARPERRAHPAVLPLHRHLERALHRARRLHRLHQRRHGHPVLLQRAVERRPVLHQPRAQGAAEGPQQPDRARPFPATTSTTSSSSATSSSSGSSSTIPSSARSRSAASGRSHQPRPAAVHERGALPPEHGLHPLPSRRDAACPDGRDLGREDRRGRLPGLRRHRQSQGHADDPGPGGPERHRPARPPDPRRQGRRGHLGQLRRQQDRYKVNPSVTPLIDQKDLKRIIVRNGHPGKTTRTTVLLVKGSGTLTVTYDSVKGGKASQAVTLK